MMNNNQLKKEQFSKFLMETMFQVKQGEVVAITADSGTDREMVFALADAVDAAGGKFLLMWVPQAEFDGETGMAVWPSEALEAALCTVDIWIEFQSIVMLYSSLWETVMRENKKMRYLVIGNTEIDSLFRTFMGFDIPTLKVLLNKVRKMVMDCKTVRITSKNGTDISYDIDLAYSFDIDDGDYSTPQFGTAPGYVNIVPKLGSMNGNIVFDELMMVNGGENSRIEFIMVNGEIVEVLGGVEAGKFKDFLASFDDSNMYKISHNMFGLNPNVRELTGSVVEDERIWGGVDFGFGHTSPIDMPPNGQDAKSHFDGIVENVTIFLDHQIIIEDGEVCHLDLKPLAEKLINPS